MSSELFEIIIPSIGFFTAFFLTYLLLEMTIVVFLNRLIFSNWGIATQVIDYPKLKRNQRIELGVSLFIALSIIALVLRSRVIELLTVSQLGTRIFALEAFLGMILIYSITTHQLIRNDFIQKVHKYLYFYLSSLVFVVCIILSDQYYGIFQNYIRANLIVPIAQNHSLVMENDLRQELLANFRYRIQKGTCPRVDFTTPDQIGIVRNMIYVTTHPDLNISKTPILRSNPRDYMTGWLCDDLRASFLLTEHGQWYWVIQEGRLAQK
ncbi:hypothetical protein HZA44_00955 [Candidatus Peregrinibacteria bacterium]|nr:hypothetical protein [Candidatus Peregrinibacteria bacterium]